MSFYRSHRLLLEGIIIKLFWEFFDLLQILRLLNGYQLRECYIKIFCNGDVRCHCYMLKSRIEMRFYLTYRPSALQTKYRPRKEKMGFALWAFGAMTSGLWGMDAVLADCLSLLASTGFVITNPFARVSVTLSKHCFWLSKCARCVSATLSKHRFCH